MQTLSKIIFAAIGLYSTFVLADLYPHKFTELQIKDYDQMTQMVEEKVNESKAIAIKMQEKGLDEEGDEVAIAKLKDALELILSRPNKDNMVAKLAPLVRTELNNYSAFESTMSSIATQAVQAIGNESLSIVQRSTAVFVLENILSEVKPVLSRNEEFRNMVRMIRDAKIEIPDKVAANRKLTSMDPTPDLSKIAGILLENAEKKAKEKNSDSE